MAKKRGLGKGLDALLGLDAALDLTSVPIQPEANLSPSIKAPFPAEFNSNFNQQVVPDTRLSTVALSDSDKQISHTNVTTPADKPASALRYLPIEFLQPGQYQPRQFFDDEKLHELASSIRAQGVMQPLVVRPLANHHYEIIAGERRWRASQLAGLTQVPCWVRALSNEAALVMALIENMQREDLNPLEQAEGLKRLQDEFAMTHQQLADSVGKSRASVTNLLRLNQLPRDIKQALTEGLVDMGHARALLGLPESQQSPALKTVLAKKLSVRHTEQLVRDLLTNKTAAPVVQEDANIRHLQVNLSDRLGAQVNIQHSASGKGKVLIHYTSLDELDGILAHIK